MANKSTPTKSIMETAYEAFQKENAKYAGFPRVKDAYNYFCSKHPKLDVVYNNFYHYYTKTFRSQIDSRKQETVIAKAAAKPLASVMGLVSTIGADEPVDIKIFNVGSQNIPEAAFEGMKTGKFIDFVFSAGGGVMPGTTVVMVGGPGTGKSTIAYDTQQSIKENNPDKKVVAICSEMNSIDLAAEIRDSKKNWMNDVDFVLLSEYPYAQWQRIIEQVLLQGNYHFVTIDSFEDIVEKLTSFCEIRAKDARLWLMEVMKKANGNLKDLQENPDKVFTSILAIQQVTKGGQFVGSNTLKHGTTGMIELYMTKDRQRFAQFTKNRRNGDVIHKKVFYTLDADKRVSYDEIRFQDERNREAMLADSGKEIGLNEEKFAQIFLNNGVKLSINENDEFLDESLMEEEEDEFTESPI